jgi:hypothetical protein
MKKAIFIFLSIIFFLCSGCQFNLRSSAEQSWVNSQYLAVKNNNLGIIAISKDDFSPLYSDILVESIVGMIEPDSVFVIAKEKDSSSISNLYQIILKRKSSICLSQNVKYALLSPDKNKMALTIINYESKDGNDKLIYMDLSSNQKVIISENLIGKPYWNEDSSKISYTISTPEGARVEVYDLKTKEKTKVKADSGKDQFSEGWITENQLLVRIESKSSPLNNKYISYNLTTNYWGETFFKSLHVISIHDIKNNLALLSYIDSTETKIVLTSISLNTPNNKYKLLEVPLYNNDYGYRSAVFYTSKFIGPHQVFYQVLTSENRDTVSCGIVDIQRKESIQLQNELVDVLGLYPLPL